VEELMLNYYTDLDNDLSADVEAMEDAITTMKRLYALAEEAKIGSTIRCPTCGRAIVKTTYHKKFSSTKCKDRYWNLVDDKRRARAIAMGGRK